MKTYHLDGTNLTPEILHHIAESWDEPEKVQIDIDPQAVQRVNAASDAVKQFVDNGDVIYGITTGFGDFKSKIIPLDQVKKLQKNILLSHATGVGPLVPFSIVRAMMTVRIQTFLRGNSGIRMDVIQALVDFVNKGVYPVIPSQGSLGASGDLAPLAHMALVLIGEWEAYYKGEILHAADILQKIGLQPIEPEAKEGLALTNGTSLICAFGGLTVYKARELSKLADIAAALSLEALKGTTLAFDPRIHQVRPHAGQTVSAANLRSLLQDSQLIRGFDPLDVQDPYSLRCSPQVHGAARDVIAYTGSALEIELNASTDNPLIFFEEDGTPVCISGGNFHGEPAAIALDSMKIGLAELGSISERRLARLIDHKENKNILPPFLINEGGLNSGFMLIQYTSASLVSENKVLAHPASVDSIPSSANTEDHVSMGTISSRQVYEIARNVENILALEIFAACQGIDFRLQAMGQDAKLGQGTARIYELVRSEVPYIESDTLMQPYIDAIRAMMIDGKLLESVSGLIE